MADATTPTHARRTRWGALGAVAALVACVGCCSIPFIAGASILGVALCSAAFLGAALVATALVTAGAAVVVYRVRKTRRPTSIPVELGPRR